MTFNPVIRTLSIVLLLGATGLALTACKIERKAEADQKSGASAAGSFENTSFDPKAEVAALWDSQLIPALDKMAVDYPALKTAMQSNLDQAGTQHGYREKGDSGPWNMAVRVAGKVVAAETELSAGTADIDVDGDGQADVQVQVGPVIRGTAIRDAMPFISFTNYANQIDFAQLANAFNDHAFEGALKDVDRSKLIGQQVELRGVFTADGSDEMPVITVIEFKVVAP
jgi:predicted lipoprotein